MSGCIQNEHGVVSEGKEAGLQSPECMVQGAAAEEQDNRLAVVEWLPAGGCKNLLAINFKIHRYAPAIFLEARKPFSKSTLMSLTSSRPTDNLIISSVIPAATNASASIRECVVVAG